MLSTINPTDFRTVLLESVTNGHLLRKLMADAGLKRASPRLYPHALPPPDTMPMNDVWLHPTVRERVTPGVVWTSGAALWRSQARKGCGELGCGNWMERPRVDRAKLQHEVEMACQASQSKCSPITRRNFEKLPGDAIP